jgi:predicted transcriptional regulator
MEQQETKKESESMKEYIDIPSFVFKDRTLSVLEVMVEYLRDNKKMRFHEIAKIINRDDRTVWTVYRRAKLKRKGIIKRSSNEE